MKRLIAIACALALAMGCQTAKSGKVDWGEISISVHEEGSAKPLPCRVRLEKPEAGQKVDWNYKPYYQEACEGEMGLRVPVGGYLLSIERGMEYTPFRALISVKRSKTVERTVSLKRSVDLAAQGWYSGDMHVHRKAEEMNLLMRAEDLHVASLITLHSMGLTWIPSAGTPPEGNLTLEAGPGRAYHIWGAEDERGPGILIYCNMTKPFDMSAMMKNMKDKRTAPEYPSLLYYAQKAREEKNVWIDVSNPYWMDIPMLVAVGGVDSVEIVNNASIWCGQFENEAWGVSRDRKIYPNIRDNGFYSQDLYYRFLNCGFRPVPTAGSASGVMLNYLGYNRTYVHLDGGFNYDEWWRQLAKGRVMVTNGPVLLVKANGALPGEVFRVGKGKRFEAALDVWSGGVDELEAVEVVRDGKVVQSLREGDLKGNLKMKPLVFEKSGWFLVRAIAKEPKTFRFASTGPFYVEVGGRRSTIQCKDAQFYLDWEEKRIEQVKKNVADPKRRAEVLKPHQRALKTFRTLAKKGG